MTSKPRKRSERERARNRITAREWGRRNAARKRDTNRKFRAAHADELAAARHRTSIVIAATKSCPCADCGGTFDPVCMDFDHRPGEAKRFNIAKFGQRTLDDVLLEIAKCDVVCANCHRIRTHRGRDHRAISHAPALVASTQMELL